MPGEARTQGGNKQVIRQVGGGRFQLRAEQSFSRPGPTTLSLIDDMGDCLWRDVGSLASAATRKRWVARLNETLNSAGGEPPVAPQALLEIDDALRDLEGPEPSGAGSELFPTVVPWSRAVSTPQLLEAIRRFIQAYVKITDEAATAATLWCVYTWAASEFDVAPYLAIVGPTRRCGKSRLLSILAVLVHRPLPVANTRPAGVFRAIELYEPTLLLDEADTHLRDNRELVGILNSGHDRATGGVLRTVGEDFEPRRFKTFGPKAIAAIGRLPETLMDRSIVVPMRRRLPHESIRPYDRIKVRGRGSRLSRALARWAIDNSEGLNWAGVGIPPQLDDRARDNWAPLFAIAEMGGPDWLSAAAQAAIALSIERDDADESLSVRLLSDIRDVWDTDAPSMSTNTVIEGLRNLTEAPWADLPPRGLTANKLAWMLRPFGVRSHQLTRGGRRSLLLRELEAAWAPYLAPQTADAADAPDENNYDDPANYNR